MAGLQLDTLANLATAFGLSYVLGFERQLRGSVVGDRTFALVGTPAAAIGIVVGYGELLLGLIVTAAILLLLEIPETLSFALSTPRQGQVIR